MPNRRGNPAAHQDDLIWAAPWGPESEAAPAYRMAAGARLSQGPSRCRHSSSLSTGHACGRPGCIFSACRTNP